MAVFGIASSLRRVEIDTDEDKTEVLFELESESHADSEFNESHARSYMTMISNMFFATVERKPSYIKGVDSWLPSNPNTIAELPIELIDSYKKIYPLIGDDLMKNGAFSVITDANPDVPDSSQAERTRGQSPTPSLDVFDGFNGDLIRARSNSAVSGSGRTSPQSIMNGSGTSSEWKTPIHHLIITFWQGEKKQHFVLSLFRSRKVTDVIALCERCRECPELFKTLPKGGKKESHMEYLEKLLATLRSHPLWKPCHIAASLGITAYFATKSRKMKSSLSYLSQPEGWSPLMIAVLNNRLVVVEQLLLLGMDVTRVGPTGQNLMHMAATASSEMIALVWNSGKCKELLNAANGDGCSPLYLAISSGNAFCASLLRSYGASLSPDPSTVSASPLMDLMKRSKTDYASIKALVDSNRDCLKEQDPITGNTVIHAAAYKKPLLALLTIAGEDMFMDARNNHMETALHVFVKRNELGLVMAICGHKVNLNAKDTNGNTPLHVAVSNLNVEIVRILLCFCANPNEINNHHETPRHMAAKMKNSDAACDIIRSLIITGANSCPSGFIGCTSGCVHKDNFVGEPVLRQSHSRSPSSCLDSSSASQKSENEEIESRTATQDDETLSDTSSVVPLAGAASGPYEYEVDPDTNVVDAAYVEPNPIRLFPQNSFSPIPLDGATSGPHECEVDADKNVVDAAYVEPIRIRLVPQISPMSTGDIEDIELSKNPFPTETEFLAIERVLGKLKSFAEKRKMHDSNVISVLSLDGGGIKGLVIVQVLLSLQKYLKAPVLQYFDWIAGTSTGSFVASALIAGRSLLDCQRDYLRFKDVIFEGWGRPYNTALLETFAKATYGPELRMSDILYPRVCFTTVRADTFPVQLELQRNYRLPLTDEENEQLGFEDPKELLVWRATRRSSAAPTYFASSEGKFIDGGMVSNNPTLDILSEISFFNSTCQFKAPERCVDIGCVISIGTGVTPISPVDPSLFEMSDMFGMLRGMKNLSLMVLDQVTATEGAPIARSRSWCHTMGAAYYRLNAPLFKDIMLDCRDDSDLAKMMWDALVYSYTHRKDFEDVANLLNSIGTTKFRKKRLFI